MNSITPICIGDVLTRPKAFGAITHKGVVIGPNLVLHNTPDRGEHVSTVEEFAAGMPLTVQPTGANPAIVIARAQAVLANPQKYDAFQNNCEHTVAKMIHGVASSPQAVAWGKVAVVAACLVGLVALGRR